MKKTVVNKKPNVFVIVGVTIGMYMISFIVLVGIFSAFLMGGLWLLDSMEEMEINTDISKYQDYIGDDAIKQYRDKWGMDELIFPQAITEEMKVEDYKMIYYNPWDAEYLSYLVVRYDEEAYRDEVERLEAYSSTEYVGYFGAEGFDENYELLAMYADAYQGFVYALTDRKDTIVYVEMIFCDYVMDIDYKEYIRKEYLPIGFDATSDNPYQKKMFN